MLKRATIFFLVFSFYFVSNAQNDSLFVPVKKIKGDMLHLQLIILIIFIYLTLTIN
jgi:hypothetical protein